MGLADLGIITRGAGADNIRNITASPTAGIDPHELIDVRPLARQMHHYILNRRELYGLPRKFNIAFDGGGSISALQETNDIGFAGVRVVGGTDPAPGVYFRMQLGGITGHRDFARDVGILLAPEQCVAVAAAAVRVFIEHGDRTDRKKARLKYLLDQWGLEKYLAEIEAQLGRPLRRFPLDRCRIPVAAKKQGHIGFHAQRQAGLCYVGVVLPVGRMTAAQMRGLAAIARCYGCGDIRLTVWQNLLISDIPVEKMDQVKRRIEALGLGWSATGVRGGLVACTGNAGCKYAASNTKAHALQIADYLGPRVALDQPINIHLTGCPHSCAQHFIGDIGLLGTKVSIGGGEEDGDDLAEGYHIYIGGGYGERQEIGREIYRDVPATEAPRVLEGMLGGYLAHRGSPQETFQEFVQRHAIEALRDLFKLQKESTDHP
jgi:ferredoxin-nitrite reductase